MRTEPAADTSPELTLARNNATNLWTRLAAARAHSLTLRPGYVRVTGTNRSGLRVNVLRPDLTETEVDEIAALVAAWPAGAKLTVEDPYSRLDLAHTGLSPKRMPVMFRDPGPVAVRPREPATHARTAAEIATAERVVVEGFPLATFHPYVPGQALPAVMFDQPGADIFLAHRDGEPAGACITVHDGTAGGVYWVATLPAHRSQGVGRALMTAAVEHLDGVAATLTATEAGRPLYESMGFRAIARATWWRR